MSWNLVNGVMMGRILSVWFFVDFFCVGLFIFEICLVGV